MASKRPITCSEQNDVKNEFAQPMPKKRVVATDAAQVRKLDFCFESSETTHSIEDLFVESGTFWELLEDENLFELDDDEQDAGTRLEDFEKGDSWSLEVEYARWRDALIDHTGKWVVTFAHLGIVKRFTSNKAAKLFIYSTIRDMNPNLSLFDNYTDAICTAQDKLHDALSANVQPQELFEVDRYSDFPQDAVCVFWEHVALASGDFPLGTGPFENASLRDTLAPHMPPNWREIFETAWRSVDLAVRSELKDVYELIRHREMARVYRQTYLRKLTEAGEQIQGFKTALCATGDLRLLYIPRQGRARHAKIWERARSLWRDVAIAPTQPVYLNHRGGCEEEEELFFDDDTGSHDHPVVSVGDGPSMEKEPQTILVHDGWLTPTTHGLTQETLVMLTASVPTWSDCLMWNNKRRAKIELPRCYLCNDDCSSVLTSASQRDFVAATCDHAREYHGNIGLLAILENTEDWFDQYYNPTCEGQCDEKQEENAANGEWDIEQHEKLTAILHHHNVQVLYLNPQGDIEYVDQWPH